MSVTKIRSSGLRAMNRTRLRPCAATLIPNPSGSLRSNDLPLASVMRCVAAEAVPQHATRTQMRRLRVRFTREKLPQISKHSHECDDIFLLLRCQFQLEHEVEKLDRIFERQQAPIVQIRRRLLNTTQRKRLDCSLGRDHHSAFHARLEKPLDRKVVHLIVRVERWLMTHTALCFAEKQIFATNFTLRGSRSIQSSQHVEFRCRRKV